MPEEIVVKPAAGKHAIEVMAFAVEWTRPLTSEVIAEIQALYERSATLREFLPKTEMLKELSVTIGSEGPSVSTALTGGMQLSRHEPDGTATWIVHIRPDLLSCSCMAYDRWETTKPKALDILLPIIALAATKDYPIQAVGVQYQDAFRLETNSPKDAARRLFLDGSRWLSPRIWHEDGPWHIHQGWFSAGMGGRIIHNILNVDLTIEDKSCLIRINGQHRMLTLTPEGASLIPFRPADVTAALDNLHNDNKAVLVQLLAQHVRGQIGLNLLEKS